MHLKPRQLSKVMLVSKGMKQAVDTEAYWSREALKYAWYTEFAAWGSVPEGVKLSSHASWVNLPRGYLHAMDDFVCSIHVTAVSNPDMYPVEANKSYSVKELFAFANHGALTESSKAYCKLQEVGTNALHKRQQKFLNRMDDIPMERHLKIALFKEVFDFLEPLVHRQQILPHPADGCIDPLLCPFLMLSARPY